MFCIRIKTIPIPNSTADKTKKKKVREIIFMLSYRIPMCKTMIYRVIHKISAVNSRCKALETFKVTVIIIKKKITKYKFKSPINIKYISTPRRYNEVCKKTILTLQSKEQKK